MHAGGDRPYCPCPRGNGGERFCFDLQQHFGKVQIWEIWQDLFFDKGRIIVRPFYVWELILILGSRTARDIKFMARERNGSILMSKQVGCSSLSPLVNISRYDWNLKMEERTWQIIAQKGLMDWRTTGGVVTTLEKSWPLHRNVGGGAEIMTVDWAALPNFFYLKTVIKLHWQNWPKTKHFPYLWPPAAEGDQAFLRHLSRLKTEPAAAQMSFSTAEKKLLPMCRHLVISWASYGYGSLWPHALCPTYLLYTNIFLQ